MLGIPFLTTAWWAAQALFVKDTAGRFLNKQAVAALAIVVGLIAVMIAGVWVVKRIESGAVAGWQSKFLLSRYVTTLRERKAQREADARAAAERETYVGALKEATEHAAALERELAALKDNPVCFPAAITKELRK